MRVPQHDDNTGLECWNSGEPLAESLTSEPNLLTGHPHCGLCCDLGEAWSALEQATAAHLVRVARVDEAFRREWRQGRGPRQKKGKQ